MLELLLCSMVTILPDYLFRRYAQGRRFGHEITLYSVWFELRWGIIACLILTVLLITLIFYYHPSTQNAVSFFRTVPLLPESSGRVEEIYVNVRDKVKAGQPIFKLDSSKQEAALETARRRIAEVDAAMEQAKVELEAADGKIQEAQGAYQQAVEELETKRELQRRNASTVAQRDIEKLENVVNGRQGGVSVAIANKKSIETQISSLLPAQKASAEGARRRGPGRTRQDGGSCAHRRHDRTVHVAQGRHRQSVDAAGWYPHSLRSRPMGAHRRLRPDRGTSDKARHDRRSDLYREAAHHHSDGGDGGSGLYRSRPNQTHGSAHRCTTGVATWNAHRLSRAAVSGWFCEYPTRAACASPMPTPTITIFSPTRTSAPGGGCFFTSLTRSHWCTP